MYVLYTPAHICFGVQYLIVLNSMFHTVHHMSRYSYVYIYILYINVYLYRVYANVSTHVRMHISYNLHLASCTLCTFIFVCPVLTQDLLASEQKVSAEPDVKVLQVLCMPLCAERDVVVCSFQPFSAVFCSLFSKHLMVFFMILIFLGGLGPYWFHFHHVR